MAIINPIFQQINQGDYHDNQLLKLLSNEELSNYILISAFVVDSGIKIINEPLKKLNKDVEIILGLRNGITSYQAVNRLLSTGCIIHGVDTGRADVLFHPKVYCGYNSKKASFIIGSSNLTLQGLHNNVEAGVTMDLMFNEKNDSDFFTSFYNGLNNFKNTHVENIIKIENKEQVESLLEQGLLVDEKLISKTRFVTKGSNKENIVSRKAMKLNVIRLKSEKIEKSDKKDKSEKKGINKTVFLGKLIYEKGSLSASDAQQVKPNTNPTGNLKLSQAGFKIDGETIDWRNYFRKKVFTRTSWAKDTKKISKETTKEKFNIIINGILYEDYELSISYDKTRIANQNNTPTWLHWEKSIELIQKANITGLSLKIYEPELITDPFVIVIE